MFLRKQPNHSKGYQLHVAIQAMYKHYKHPFARSSLKRIKLQVTAIKVTVQCDR